MLVIWSDFATEHRSETKMENHSDFVSDSVLELKMEHRMDYQRVHPMEPQSERKWGRSREIRAVRLERVKALRSAEQSEIEGTNHCIP